MVVELADVALLMPESVMYGDKMQTAEMRALRSSEVLAHAYFDFDAVIARLNYKAAKDANSGS
jgi:hypothetical protein